MTIPTIESSTPTPTRSVFADVATVRAAIADVIDAGSPNPNGSSTSWLFFLSESESETKRRVQFIDAVCARLAELQSRSLAVRIEDYCDRHKRVRMFTSEKCCPDCQREEKR